MTDGVSVQLRGQVGSLTLDVTLPPVTRTLVVIGPNGAGKSTLLAMLLGVKPVQAGRVCIGPQVLFDSATGVNVPVEERQLAWVPQESGLIPQRTVQQNLDFAVRCGATEAAREERRTRAAGLVTQLDLRPFVTRDVGTLSGGERQRVALARALCTGPRALLMDEPLAALDVSSRREVRRFLAGWLEQLTIPTLVVSHDADDARALGQHLAVLEAGRLTQHGTWSELAAAPASNFVREFTGAPSVASR
ncbi:MAG: ATP-binding cassette domain-containing protein [Archangium sp.]|nr:ATP-binding cassette domain-containing protein [Archangium sp.]